MDERTFCVESELINRPDGLKGMLEKYGVPLGSQGVPAGQPQDLPDRRDLRRDRQGRVQLR